MRVKCEDKKIFNIIYQHQDTIILANLKKITVF